MRGEIISIGQFTSHPGLHVGIVRVRLQGTIHYEFPVGRNLQQSRLPTQFRDQGVAIGQPLGSAYFAILLAQLVVEYHLLIPREFPHLFSKSNENIAIWQNLTIA